MLLCYFAHRVKVNGTQTRGGQTTLPSVPPVGGCVVIDKTAVNVVLSITTQPLKGGESID